MVFWAKIAGSSRGVRMFHTWPGCPKTKGHQPTRATRSEPPYRACKGCLRIMAGGPAVASGGPRVQSGRTPYYLRGVLDGSAAQA